MVGLKAGTYTPCRCDLEQLAALGEECGLRAGFLKGWVGLEREKWGRAGGSRQTNYKLNFQKELRLEGQSTWFAFPTSAYPSRNARELP